MNTVLEPLRFGAFRLFDPTLLKYLATIKANQDFLGPLSNLRL